MSNVPTFEHQLDTDPRWALSQGSQFFEGKLPAEFADELDPYVRAKFLELWSASGDDPHQDLSSFE